MSKENNIMFFSLKDIANWQLKPDDTKVTIPALQRGLVWRPKQIELLWDSLMRGIPIGSFVICKEIEKQRKKIEKEGQYHLLDGQQRVNAIQLGFDSFSDKDKIINIKKSILWLDLAPQNLPLGSSRNFLFRVTTPAHPWGYTKGDNEDYLSAGTIREWVCEHLNKKTSDREYQRPRPEEMQPIEANYPIPVSLLIAAFDEGTKNINKDKLIESVEKSSGTWVENILNVLASNELDLNLKKISKGIDKALSTSLLALVAPDELLESSQQEKINDPSMPDITSIEHLFQRLNQQGTRLDGEELSYSLIKAYYPEITDIIDDVSKEKMPSSRLVTLAFRAILSEEGNKLTDKISVSQIRKLAKDENKDKLRKEILRFIREDLKGCCEKIDKWLGVNPKKCWGLPPVLRSSIVYNDQNLYLLLMLLAKNYNDLSENCCKMLTGLLTSISWFCPTNKKNNIISEIYAGFFNSPENLSLNEKVISIILQKIAPENYYYILPPEQLCKLIQCPDDNLEKWKLFNLVDNIEDENTKTKTWDFLQLYKNKDLLLYAQRGFIIERFRDYDPARKDLWDNHNRPWDFDHILPNSFFKNKKIDNAFMYFCSEWGNSIGNFRAWPFEDNRSDQADKADTKINTDELKSNSFINEDEFLGLNQDRDVIKDIECAKKMANACKNRIIRIYSEWYSNLMIEELYGLNTEEKNETTD